MAKLKVYGRPDDARVSTGAGTGRFLKAEVAAGISIDSSRAGVEPLELDLADDDIVQIILEDGLSQWVSFERLRQDLGSQLSRGGEPGELVLPPALRIGGPSRGAGDWAIKGLRVLKVDLAGMAGAAVAAHLEEKLDAPGLCRWMPGEGRPTTLEDGDFPSGGPVLLFLHGTASRTEASFGGLAAPEQKVVRNGIRKLYDDRVLAFEHATLTKSPIENAIDLLERIPEQTPLHIVSHSRGGLIGEILCRAGRVGGRIIDETDAEIFEGHPDAEALERLGALLAERKPRIERFVRVACPANGTTLASRRLDRYLSILVNLAGLIPALKSSPVFEFMTSLLLAVVKQRTDPEKLPGLAAQMPSSPLIRALNRPDISVDAGLHVVSGDIEGGGVLQRLGILATDAFYCEDHDLVVNTRAMYGGAARAKPARFFFDRGPAVNHFSYFSNRRTANAILAGLEGKETEPFRVLERAGRELAPEAFRSRSPVPQPTVFVVPGIMGSHLTANGDRVWLDLLDLAFGGMKRLGISASNVRPQRLVGSAYDELCRFLADSHEVVPFPYDWRRSLLEEAERFGDAVEERLESTDLPVRIIAHSMGGLLTRTMIAKRPETWTRLCQRSGGRLIMLGTPNGGSYVIPRVLLGREKLIRQLGMLDLKHSTKRLLEIVARFRGMLELLPAGEAHDFFDGDVWAALRQASAKGWVLPRDEDLEAARSFRNVLESSPIDPAHMLYVAGLAPATPVGHEIVDGEVRFLATAKGDGRVPWSTGIPKQLDTVYYMDAEHGGMAAHRPSFPALLDLLESGSTTRLTTLPFVTRGVEDRFPMPEPDPQMFPDSDELEAAAVGLERTIDTKTPVSRVRVWISHGNLAFARYPVAVGHYEGDTIVSAEGALDSHLEGRLSERHRIGLYPGPIRTADVLLNRGDRQPGGAIVMGLGRVGSLTAGLLTATFTQACLRYVTAVRDRDGGDADNPPSQELRMTSLLIGTGESGLTVEDSIRGILAGVRAANDKLADRDGGQPVRIVEVELIELYEDRAVQAARVLRRLVNEDAFGRFDMVREVKTGRGGRQRVFYDEDPQWWRPLQIRGDTGDDRGLEFLAITDRAGAPVMNQPNQRRLVDGLIASSVATTARDSKLAQTMYELLIPNPLKEQATERRNMLLVVDERAAAYPWELLENPTFNEPVSIGAGMIRQLITDGSHRPVVSTIEDRALVIGDPISEFEALPAAAQEALGVVQLLSADDRFEVISSIREGAREILNKLYASGADGAFGYKVLHVAAHGVYQEGDNGETGIVIGPRSYLTPLEIGQIRRVPELVFLNCCYLGFIEGEEHKPSDRHKLAANVSTQLIRMGVRAVVAAGWAVNDGAAATFADRFYREMLDGREFGVAVRLARQHTFSMHGSLNTWGAYQCYGDPGYTLRRGGDASGSYRYEFSHPAEAVSELLNLAGDATATAAYGETRLVRKFEGIVAGIPEDWRKRGDIEAALGEAYGQLDRFAEAIEHFEGAARAEKATQPVRSLERHINFEARNAADRWLESESDGDRKEAQATIRSALDRLEKLISLGRTSERMSIRGSAYKRMAVVSTGASRDDALKEAMDSYSAAHEIEGPIEFNTYPLLNWLACLAVQRWRKPWSGADGRVFREKLEQANLRANELDMQDPSFFHAAARGECVLVRHLGVGDLAEHVDEVVDGYGRAWQRGGSRRELSSVTEHLRMLRELLGDASPGKDSEVREKMRASLRHALDGIQTKLEAMARPPREID